MTVAADFERASSNYVFSSGTNFSGLTGNFTWMTWWRPESLVAGEDQLFLELAHTSGGNAVRIWKTDSAGSHRLRMRVQEVGGAAPLANEHVDVEWDINALVSAGTYVHMALVFTVANPVATIAELFTDTTSRGNGTVVSGTDCSSVVVSDNGARIGLDKISADGLDGLLFNYQLWVNEIRSGAQIASDYLFTYRNTTSHSNLHLNLWKGGAHHVNSTMASSGGDGDWSPGPVSAPAFATTIPAGMDMETGNAPGRLYEDGPSTYEVMYADLNQLSAPGREYADGPGVFEVMYNDNNLLVAPGELVTLTAGVGTNLRYRMRAVDTGLARVVYWTASFIDALGTEYTGPGPLTGIVVSKVIGT